MTIKPHLNIRADIAAWRRSLSADPTERHRLAKEFWAEFVAALTTAGGPPPGSTRTNDPNPDCWWCPFPPGYLALVWFRRTGGFLGFWSKPEAVVLELNFSPGLPD